MPKKKIRYRIQRYDPSLPGKVITHKICRICGELKSINAFEVHRATCRNCVKERTKTLKLFTVID